MRVLVPLFIALFVVTHTNSDTDQWKISSLRGRCCFEFTFHAENARLIYGVNREQEVYKSINGGLSWSNLRIDSSPQFRRESLGRVHLRIHPLAADYLFLLSSAGFFRSEDTGKSWEKIGPVPEFFFTDVEFDPSNPSVLYASGDRGFNRQNESAVLKSTDGGKTWQMILSRPEPRRFRGILIHPQQSSKIYIQGARSLHRSDNGGSTWTTLPSLPNNTIEVIFDPSTPDTLYAAALREIFKSTDSGKSWLSTHCDCYAWSISIDPANNSYIYAATNFDVIRSTDAGNSWHRLNLPSIESKLPRILRVHPLEPNVVFTTTLYEVLLRSNDRGKNWNLITKGGAGYLSQIEVAQESGEVLVAGPTVLKSHDRGKTWIPLNNGFPGESFSILAFKGSKLNPNLLGVTGRLFTQDNVNAFRLGITEDSGSSWRFSDELEWTNFVFSTNNRNIIYASVFAKGMVRSDDFGGTWKAINTGLTHRSITAIAAAGKEKEVIYVGTTKSSIFRSDNGGQRWTKRDAGLPRGSDGARIITVDSEHPDSLYVAIRHRGIFFSSNGGRQWAPKNRGIPSEFIPRFLVIDPLNSSILYTGGFTCCTGETDRHYFLVSHDSGNRWQSFTRAGLRFDRQYFQLLGLAISSTAPQILYLLTDDGVYTLLN